MDSKELAQALEENQDALKLLRSDEWRVYSNWLIERVRTFQNQVNDFVEKGDIVGAQIKLALMKDNLRLKDVFKQQILQKAANLKKENTDGGS